MNAKPLGYKHSNLELSGVHTIPDQTAQTPKSERMGGCMPRPKPNQYRACLQPERQKQCIQHETWQASHHAGEPLLLLLVWVSKTSQAVPAHIRHDFVNLSLNLAVYADASDVASCGKTCKEGTERSDCIKLVSAPINSPCINLLSHLSMYRPL